MRRVCNQKDNDLQIREEVKFGEQSCIASGCIIGRIAGSFFLKKSEEQHYWRLERNRGKANNAGGQTKPTRMMVQVRDRTICIFGGGRSGKQRRSGLRKEQLDRMEAGALITSPAISRHQD